MLRSPFSRPFNITERDRGQEWGGKGLDFCMGFGDSIPLSGYIINATQPSPQERKFIEPSDPTYTRELKHGRQ